MKPSKNDLLIHFDAVQGKVVVYRLLADDLPLEKVIHTEYELSALQQNGFDSASKLIGEDILVSLEGTRDTIR